MDVKRELLRGNKALNVHNMYTYTEQKVKLARFKEDGSVVIG